MRWPTIANMPEYSRLSEFPPYVEHDRHENCLISSHAAINPTICSSGTKAEHRKATRRAALSCFQAYCFTSPPSVSQREMLSLTSGGMTSQGYRKSAQSFLRLLSRSEERESTALSPSGHTLYEGYRVSCIVYERL